MIQRQLFASTQRWVVVLVLAAGLCGFALPVGQRVGDGSEYYAMLVGFVTSGHPWVTDADWRVYEAYRPSLPTLVDQATLQKWFSSLRRNGQQDFQHAWFYSLLAAPFGKVLALAGLDIGYAFNLLHALLFFAVTWIAWLEFRSVGLSAALILLLLSPARWYLNKAHTEFLVISLGLLAVVWASKGKWQFSAICLAVVSTQYPPFGLVAGMCLAAGLWHDRRHVLKPRNVWSVSATVALGVAVPMYYWMRYGAVHPQQVTHLITVGHASWQGAGALFVDPDIGLLLNFPLALVAVAASMVLAVRERRDKQGIRNVGWAIAASLAWIAVLLPFQLSAGNPNHGATVSISRYALWYIPIVFFPLVYVLQRFRKMRLAARSAVLALSIAATWYTVELYSLPSRETFTVPTPISKWVYRNIPWIYDPLPEVFAERYSFIGDGALFGNEWAFATPDVSKLLVRLDTMPTQDAAIAAVQGNQIPIDRRKLLNWIAGMPSQPSAKFLYLEPSGEDMARIRAFFPLNEDADLTRIETPDELGLDRYWKQDFNEEVDLTRIETPGGLGLDRYWKHGASRGVWSTKTIVDVTVDFEALPASVSRYELRVRAAGFVTAIWPRQRVAVFLNGVHAGDFTLSAADDQVPVQRVPGLKVRAGLNRFRFHLLDTISPRQLGISRDGRRLGIRLERFGIYAQAQ